MNHQSQCKGSETVLSWSHYEDLHVIKGAVDPSNSNAKTQIDGLAGATLTANGVSNLIKFWMGENGFRPFINNLKAGEA